jgi:hypothetical protein
MSWRNRLDAAAANVRSDSHGARFPVSGVSNPTRLKVRPPARIVSPSTTSIAPGSIGLASAVATVSTSRSIARAINSIIDPFSAASCNRARRKAR